MLHYKYTSETCQIELRRISEKVGHAPSYEDVRKHGSISPRTMQRYLGPSWDNVKASIGWMPEWEQFRPDLISQVDGAWLSGIIDGEGCFRMQAPVNKNKSQSYALSFCVSLREDDSPMLDEISRIIGRHAKYYIDNRERESINANPAYKLFVRDIPTIKYHLIPILELYPLRSKKRFELPVFKLAASIIFDKWQAGRKNMSYTDDERAMLHHCYLALSEMKAYHVDYDEIAKRHNLATS